MIVEIRVVVEVPEQDRDRQQDVIEAVTEAVREKLPNLRKAARHSPITVTIRELNEDVG